jgi:hypothetical protein
VSPPVTRSTYAAALDLFPARGEPTFAYAIVKLSYRIDDQRCVPVEPAPLFHDIRDPKIAPRWARGSDFWPLKCMTDVALRGSAFAAAGKPVPWRCIGVSIGGVQRRIDVFGERRLEWKHGTPRISAPESFTEVEMDWDKAYGGWDPRVPVDAPETVDTLVRLQLDHPGVYPRNPYGSGYLVVDEPVDSVRLPQLEDPAHRLQADTLVTRDPRLWHRQPLPVCWEFTTAMMFHRYCWVGAEAWHHPAPNVPLAEVEVGALPTNFHELAAMDPMQEPAPLPFYQEAAIGLSFAPLAAGTPIVVTGMHPARDVVSFALPAAPFVVMRIEEEVEPLSPQLTQVLVEPCTKKQETLVHLTYVVRQPRMPRVFIPGIHVKIPISIEVNGDAPVRYEPPPSLHAQLKAAGAVPAR